MKHLGLFEGIGGFSLAARWIGWETVAWVEINKFCQQVLKKNFPEAKGYGDIKEFDGTQYRGAIDIITGGFPCQPYSTAGKRKGKEDDRHLWPEMLRVIREIQPAWVVGENVRGLTNWSGGLVFDEVQADLEAEGYEVTPFLLPACAVNAPHRRDRIWFIAYSPNTRIESLRSERKDSIYEPVIATNAISSTIPQREYREIGCKESENNSDRNKREWIRPISKRAREERIVTNSNARRLQGSENETQRQFTINRNAWDQFPTVSPVCGGNDGISNRMDRIKALGNAIVPQVAFEIFKAIDKMNNL